MTDPDFTSFLQSKQRHLQQSGQHRPIYCRDMDGVYAIEGERRLLSFCSNDYLGIAASLRDTSCQSSAGAGASRLICGTNAACEALETTLAEMKGTESALLFGSGYMANIGVIPALVQQGDMVIMDRYAHACMIDGVRLSGASFFRYRHNDMAHLEALLKRYRQSYRHCLLLTETVFSMDGDVAPLSEMQCLAQQYGCWLMTDDAHGMGLTHLAESPAHIQMGTLSKAVGVYGGYVCGSQLLKEHCFNYARTVMFSTALPESVMVAALHALRMMKAEPHRSTQVMQYATQLSEALGIPTPSSPIIPVMLGTNERAVEAQQQLLKHDILVAAIRPPTVPKGTARLRISLSAAHQLEHIEQLIAALRAMGLTKH